MSTRDEVIEQLLRDFMRELRQAKRERDALAARLASAEAKLAKVEEALWCFHFIEGNPLQADGLAVVERVRAALAGDTTLRTVDRDRSTAPEPTEPCAKPMHKRCECVRPKDHDGYCNCTYRNGGSAIPEQEARK